ncbi:hypothetical protein H3V53_03425 [Paraburkholderia bengalensis]|uniref:Uncharacterized protein n=1 Tax=Paraburkholderia bengalensis TaxID=2747562 RepID=A0ABU8IL12_9BURK
MSDVILERWTIRETNHGERHFTGWNVVDAEGRVSTPIQTFDPVTRTGTTASGSCYQLRGRAGYDKDAEHVWQYAARMWKITSWIDVTSTLVPDFKNPNPRSDMQAPTEMANVSSLNADSDSAQTQFDAEPASRLATIRYRAIAYEAEQPVNRSLPNQLRSEVVDEGRVAIVALDPPDSTLEFLACVRVLLGERVMSRATRQAFVALPSRTMVFIESVEPGAHVGEKVAKLDVTVDVDGVRAGMFLDERPRIDLGPLQTINGEGIWQTVLRFLPTVEVQRESAQDTQS